MGVYKVTYQSMSAYYESFIEAESEQEARRNQQASKR